MAILKKIYLILILFLLASCEEEFNPNMPYTPALCINSLITNGDEIDINITKSRLYTKPQENVEVKNVDVSIYANGQLQLDSYLPHENDNIKIVAESKLYGRAEADVVIPKPIPEPKIKWEVFDVYCWADKDYFGDEITIEFKLKVELTIDDPEEENYYKFSYFSTPDVELRPDGLPIKIMNIDNLQYTLEPIFSEHIGIFESLYGGDASGFTFFTDRQFSGKSYTLHLQFDSCRFRYLIDNEDIPECKSHFVIHNISPSYYNWANYIWQRDNGVLSDFSDYGLGDQICGYSNVSSGAGVVAAQSRSVCSIDFTDFIKQTIQHSQSKSRRLQGY